MRVFDLINRLRALQETMKNLREDNYVSAEEYSLMGETIEYIMEREKSLVSVQSSLREAVREIGKND